MITVAASYDTINDTVFGIDPNISSESEEFGLADSIVIGLVSAPIDSKSLSFEEWYKGIYYYQVTRYGTPSINFHYVVSSDAQLVTNQNSQPERKIAVEDVGYNHPILIGLLLQDEIGMTPLLKTKLPEILLDIANKNAIPIDRISIKQLKFEETSQRNLIIKADTAFGTWESDIAAIKSQLVSKYNPVVKEYKIEMIGNPTISQSKLKAKQEFEVKLKIKNTGEETIYEGTEGEFFMTLKSQADKSKFFINNIWASQTQAKFMNEGEVLRPAEEKEYIFKGIAPLEIGSVSETFEITSTTGKKFPIKEIIIKIELEKPDAKIIEIGETETGYLRVRSKADFNSEEVDRVSPGDRFFVIETTGGFTNIDLGNGKTGWVYSKYVKSIQ